MKRTHVEDSRHSGRKVSGPLAVAIAVAVFGVLGIVVVDYEAWHRPQVQTAEIANYKTTGEAARAVGATVTPTDPKPAIEPAPAGPKPAQPADPASR
jgi:hypothetical protein